MTKELAQNLLYANSSYELWKELGEQHGHMSAPLIFQLQHEVTNLRLGNQSVSAYYNKMKRCWDELQAINVVPICTCGHN